MSLAFPFCICSILQKLPKFKSFALRNLSRWKNEGGSFKEQVINSYENYESKLQMWKFWLCKILTGIFTSVMLSILHDCPADNECASYFLTFRGV